MNGGLLGSWWT